MLPDFFNNTVYFNLTSLGFACLLPVAVVKKKLPSKMKMITIISIVSYSIYLIHYSFVLRSLIWLNIEPVLAYISYWLLSFFAALILYNYFEKPMTNLRDRKL